MEDLKTIFLDLKETDKHKRVARTHPIVWYVGLDDHNRYSLFVITKTQPKSISSTKLMNVFVGERKDGNYGITFSLQEKRNLDLFTHFCEDMISYTSHISKTETAADTICGRYIQWQKAFLKDEGIFLSYEQIRGLIGELCFLKMKMIPLYGPEKAIESWSGIESTDQCFTCDGTWYEVKSTVSGASAISISSVEQLDVSNTGYLVVITLDKTSAADTSKLTLNSMVEQVAESIPSKVYQDIFLSRLLAFGYCYEEAYDKIGFKFNGMTTYKVDSEFPCLRKKDIPASVQNAKYELSLAAIDSFKVE